MQHSGSSTTDSARPGGARPTSVPGLLHSGSLYCTVYMHCICNESGKAACASVHC